MPDLDTADALHSDEPASDALAMIEMTTELVAAFVSNNRVQPADMPALIATVHQALAGLGQAPALEATAEPLKPAVPVKKSVTDEFIVSLEDGRKFRSMKRYLGTLGMTPDQYRAKWGLPKDYPMVAPNYAAQRSALAKTTGLGNQRRKTAAAEPDAVPAEAPKKRGRPKQTA